MKRLPLLQLGAGTVGKQVITILLQIRERIRTEHQVDLGYVGLWNSTGGISHLGGLSDQQLRQFPHDHKPLSIDFCINALSGPFILIDTTAADTTGPLLTRALEKGGAVVLSNKKPLATTQQLFDTLHDDHRNRLLYETTVGAGLPVLSTLNTLLETGDTITSIQGCFSGTLGFLFSELEKGTSFSSAVREAKQRGFTEPDPRDDLSGTDVARKALILARTIGKKMELSDIALTALYPADMQTLTVEQFLDLMPHLDRGYALRMEKAQALGKTWRYVATVTQKECRVGLELVDSTSDLGSLHGPDNLITIHTARYNTQPLVIKGPGAGAAVTAAGVVGDIMHIVGHL